MPTIRKRNGKFQAQVRIKQGGYIVYQESATFDSAPQAKLWGLTLEKKLRANGHSERVLELKTVGSVVSQHQQMMSDLGRDDRGSWNSIKAIEAAPFINKPIGHVKVEDLTAWIKARAAGYTNYKGETVVPAPATLLHHLMTLRSIYRTAATMHGIPCDPQIVSDAAKQLARLKVVGNSAKRDRRVSDSEAERIATAFEFRASKIPMRTIITLAIALPRRCSELMGMLWSDYNGRTVLLRDTKDPNAVRRDEVVPVPPQAQDIIASLPKVSDKILPYNSDTVSNAFAWAAEQAGLGDIHFHDLRHEGISRLFAAGLNIPEVSMISGHKNWATLQRYTHIKPSDVLDKLNANRTSA